MVDQPRHKAAWIRWLTGTALTVAFAVVVVWGARAYGRSIAFAFGVNWVLMMWAIMFASNVVPLRLPAQYYVTRRFEKGGRVYDRLGVRWYRRALAVAFQSSPQRISRPVDETTSRPAEFGPNSTAEHAFAAVGGQCDHEPPRLKRRRS
jgi:hypothetical protein